MEYTIGYINSVLNNRKIFIWGAWNRGKEVQKWLEKNGIWVEGYVDSKVDGKYNDKNVYRINTLGLEKSFIIVSTPFHSAIENELHKRGFEENIDYLYMGSEVTVSKCNNYHDIYENHIEGKVSEGKISLSCGSKLYIQECIGSNKYELCINGFSQINIGKKLRIGKNVKIICRDGSSITIGDNVVIDDDTIIWCDNCSKIIIYDNVTVQKDSDIRCLDNSVIELKKNISVDRNAIVEVKTNSQLYFEEYVHLCRYAKVYSWRGGMIKIGKYTSLGQNLDMRSGTDTKLVMGEDCMVSYQVRIRSHNGHTIIDLENESSYETKRDCVIGDHVWIGTGALVMPGAYVGKGSIVGANSFVNKEFGNHELIAGTPARKFRENVDWDRREAISYEEWIR